MKVGSDFRRQLIVFFLTERLLVEGLTAGAEKG